MSPRLFYTYKSDGTPVLCKRDEQGKIVPVDAPKAKDKPKASKE